MESPKEEVLLLRIRHAKLVTISRRGDRFKIGKEMDRVEIIENGTVIVNQEGLIIDVGTDEELSNQYANKRFLSDVDATGMSVVPGFVDAHSHPVWSGDRVHEFAMKLAGATYMDIHKMGGGIGFTMEKTKQSSEEELKSLLKKRLDRFLSFGTTTLEGKSGYGDDLDSEVRLLKVLHEADQEHPVEIVSTYLGAHSVPKGLTAAQHARNVIEIQLPRIIELKQEGVISPRNIDVFLEKGIFESEETKQILEAGKAAGLLLNFHGDEIHPMGSGLLGGKLGATAISHLERVDDEGIEAMSIKPTVAVLLPTTAYVLRIEPPPARKLIEGGVPVALGSDFNPNAHCQSMAHVMNLACVTMRMTMNEALVAATLNAAASLDLSHSHGSIEVGKVADFVVIDHPSWEHIIYEMADPPIQSVYKRGKRVFTKSC
eukprot:TRINITY_DN4631_c0_g2_i1.p1 TRINITY_DN4631_c0_g2~~TRINITY_DN4631_c0_g2_i1.p1  ORF type:complete len:455 (-),score=81.33 TRINITY_DN4631_c0_g2_i1:12-1301(-)